MEDDGPRNMEDFAKLTLIERLRNDRWPVVLTLILIIGVIAATTLLGVAKLAVAGVYFNDCELDPRLPIFLIVDACIALLLLPGCNPRYADVQYKAYRVIILWTVVGAFLLAWLITGTVWICNVRDTIYSPGHCQNETVTEAPMGVTNTAVGGAMLSSGQSHSSSSSSNGQPCVTCHHVLADFVLGVVIAQWTLFGLTFLILLFMFLRSCCECVDHFLKHGFYE